MSTAGPATLTAHVPDVQDEAMAPWRAAAARGYHYAECLHPSCDWSDEGPADDAERAAAGHVAVGHGVLSGTVAAHGGRP